MNKAWLGLFLALVATLLGSLFYAKSYHDLYWLNPAVLILSTTIGVASASAGGFLLGKHLVAGRELGVGALHRLSIGLGTVVGLGGSMLGVVRLLGSRSASPPQAAGALPLATAASNSPGFPLAWE